ncbi:hypothetical protein JN11_00868 [Mucilaginibacter frigoritolerans]|uniref:Uncharacterized protein n=1 Tax=Mucilaginibacter frigoritolerans TaxID=652788 RepID=A0A562UBY8_9SPHI|nr:DUF6090 family protein [Mucilaginibacter frigoritolerans]TWJ03330.1 hypothetical protein JN11_00868 [Mucilaginibacter frigoritolerans]
MEKEIKDHVVKAYKVFKKPGISFWHKLGEIGIEVGIIVFAVTLSIWLHDISEHNREQKDVKSFLLGLKNDLTNDIIELRGDRDSYIRQGVTFNYIATPAPNFKISADSVKKYQPYLFNITSFTPNNGKYEGFKSSGKLGNIEDDSLQNNITELYQRIIPAILLSTNGYTQRKQALFQCFYENLKKNKDGSNNMLVVLSSDEFVNISGSLISITEIRNRYDAAIEKSQQIIKEINADYGLN